MVPEDFNNIIERAGYPRQHFVISAHVEGTITARYRGTGAERSYRRLDDFERDLSITPGVFTNFNSNAKLFQLKEKLDKLTEYEKEVVLEMIDLGEKGRRPDRSQCELLKKILIPD